MLRTETVEPHTLELLKLLSKQEALQDFYLVGGTSLALQIGHRNSIDLDFFGKVDMADVTFSSFLSEIPDVVLLKKSKNILVYTMNGIKVDFVNYHYPWLEECKLAEGIRLASRKDIGAMKLSAIAGRGSRKDFVDLYFLLKEYSLAQLIGFYKEKFRDGSEFLVLKSLSYFSDADAQSMPIMFQNVTWEDIKKTILWEVKQYMKI